MLFRAAKVDEAGSIKISNLDKLYVAAAAALDNLLEALGLEAA